MSTTRQTSMPIGRWSPSTRGGRRLFLTLALAVVGCEPVSPDAHSELTGRWVSRSQLSDESGDVGCEWVDRVLAVRPEGWLVDSLFTPEDTDVEASTCETSLLSAHRRSWELLAPDLLVIEPGFASERDTLLLHVDADSLRIGPPSAPMLFVRGG